ncbi:MAG: hypothetical protein ABIN61_08055 [candidate division WOR-3 bacterium]
MDKLEVGVLWFFVFVRTVIFFLIIYFIIFELRKFIRKQKGNGKRD